MKGRLIPRRRSKIVGIGGFHKPHPGYIYFQRKRENKIENDSDVNKKKRIKKETNLTKNKEKKKKEEKEEMKNKYSSKKNMGDKNTFFLPPFDAGYQSSHSCRHSNCPLKPHRCRHSNCPLKRPHVSTRRVGNM